MTNRQKGFASIPLIIFMLVTVTFVITQAFYSNTSRLGDDVARNNSTAAFFLAESGIETTIAQLNKASDADTFKKECEKISPTYVEFLSANGITVNRKLIAYSATTDNKFFNCKVRFKATDGNTVRRIEKTATYTENPGFAGLSLKPTADSRVTTTEPLTYRNADASKQKIALLTSAYRVSGSDGVQELVTSLGLNTAGNATTSTCAGCALWNYSVGNGPEAVGSVMIASEIAAGKSISLQQNIFLPGTPTTPAPRNYVQIAAVIEGASSTTQPVIRGTFWSDSPNVTSAPSNSNFLAGNFPNGSASDFGSLPPSTNACRQNGGSCACYQSDLLVFAVSTRSDSTLLSGNSVKFASMVLDFDDSKTKPVGYNIAMDELGNFPEGRLEDVPGAYGDLFIQMWFKYNELLFATLDATDPIAKAHNDDTITLKIGSTTGKAAPNNYVRLFESCTSGGGCNFAPGTKVLQPFDQAYANQSQFVRIVRPSGLTDATIKSQWKGKKICGGVCALQRIPSASSGGSSKTPFCLRLNAASGSDLSCNSAGGASNNPIVGFAGGFLCIAGVGRAPDKITFKTIGGNSWREITSDDVPVSEDN